MSPAVARGMKRAMRATRRASTSPCAAAVAHAARRLAVAAPLILCVFCGAIIARYVLGTVFTARSGLAGRGLYVKHARRRRARRRRLEHSGTAWQHERQHSAATCGAAPVVQGPAERERTCCVIRRQWLTPSSFSRFVPGDQILSRNSSSVTPPSFSPWLPGVTLSPSDYGRPAGE